MTLDELWGKSRYEPWNWDQPREVACKVAVNPKLDKWILEVHFISLLQSANRHECEDAVSNFKSNDPKTTEITCRLRRSVQKAPAFYSYA